MKQPIPEHVVELFYTLFFTSVPDQSNPTDLNTIEKWNFFQAQGFEVYKAMQTARKQGKEYTKP